MSSINDALIEAVKAMGGSKQVAPLLWPEKAPDAAQRQLLDCLNPERPANLSPDHVMLVLRLARERGLHGALQAMCAELGYSEPLPVQPHDEAAELQRQYIAAARDMARIADRLERLHPVLRTA